MVYDLKETTVKMALDLPSAETLVQKAKEDGRLVEHSIKEKYHKKSDTLWYEVKIVQETWKSSDLLEGFVSE